MPVPRHRAPYLVKRYPFSLAIATSPLVYAIHIHDNIHVVLRTCTTVYLILQSTYCTVLCYSGVTILLVAGHHPAPDPILLSIITFAHFLESSLATHRSDNRNVHLRVSDEKREGIAEIDANRGTETGLATAIRLYVLAHYRNR